jgi:ER lumen protein retaining receptor
MRKHRVVSQTYDAEQDTFRVVFLVAPSMLLAMLINHEFSFTEVLWTFSIYLEAVAILPQLVLLQRTKNVDTLTGNYVFLLGGYRALYLLNWIYRFLTEPGIQAVDRVGERRRADRRVLRLFLLLLEILAQK